MSPNSATYDGNGNVIGYVDMATGAKSATYEYSAFGETLIADGPMQDAFPFRFSTKYHDPETGLINYGLRIYSPSTGRFINHDPAEEDGGVNLYAFVENDGVNAFDFLGLWITAAHNAIADRWLGADNVLKCCCGDIDVTNTVKNASARVDGFVGIKFLRGLPNLNPFSSNALWKAQAARNDYKHHLTEQGEDYAVMEQRWNAFIDGKLAEAKRLAGENADNCKNIKAALAAIGQAFHVVSDAHSPMHKDGQEWDGLGHELAQHPVRTLHGHPAGESVKVWEGRDRNYPFSAQEQRDTIDDLDSRLRGTLDQVLKGCKK